MSEAPEGAEDHAYFQAIERLFLRLRGSPLLLSPADWQITRGWRAAGIPLRLVGRTLQETFERREREGKEKVQSLAYLKPIVERAWKKERELVPPPAAAPPELDLAARLGALADALGAKLPERNLWRERILALEGAPEVVENALAELDEECLEAASSALPPAELEAIESELSEALGALARRLSSQEAKAAGQRLRERLLRQRVGLPLLSLFAPEAEPP